jgi:hypothetical protein
MSPHAGFLAARIVLLVLLGSVLFCLALGRPLSRRLRALLFVVVAGALLSYPNFGFFHAYRFVPIHYWDAYHYFMGAKYLPELGYFKLYEATYVAGRELDLFADVTYIRDLPSYRGRDVRSIDVEAIRARFSPGRWLDFKRDLAFLSSRISKWQLLFLDHGYNDPPPRALLLHVLVRWLPADPLTLAVLTSLDYLVILATFGFVWWAWGTLPAALACSFLALSFFARFDYIGGSILRWDWTAALLIGVAVFARGFGRTAGILLGYAILARVFPILLLVPLGIKWLQGRRAGTRDESLARCLLWAVGGVLVVWVVLAGTGLRTSVLPEFLAKMQVHNVNTSTNRIGLGSLLVFHSVPWNISADGLVSVDGDAVLAAAPPSYVLPLASALYLLIALPLILRARPLESMMYAVPLIFCAVSTTGYYYSFLVLLVLLPWMQGRPDRLRLLGMAALTWIMAVSYVFEIRSPQLVPLFYKLSIQMALFFLLWLGIEYVRLSHRPIASSAQEGAARSVFR